MGILDADAHPLYWPEQWPRTAPSARERTTRYKITFSDARDRLVHELKLLGAIEIVLSTNIPLRRDGLPRMDIAEPSDAGVAVYWIERGKWDADKHDYAQVPRVIACDHWQKVRDNIRAVGLAVEALRALKRCGATQIADKAFTGFAALPAHAGASSTGARPWRVVLGLNGGPLTRTQIEDAYMRAVRTAHPDLGGTQDLMVEVNAAYREAVSAIEARP
jgi:hypothetical protein